MSWDWADNIAQQLSSQGLMQTGICLILGAADTGKTTLATALAQHLAQRQPVGIIDADIGQSHIGPPTTVGWAVVDKPQLDFSQLAPAGISFVGHVTPVGHLLQLTAAIVQGADQLSKVTDLVIIDTPGLIKGSAAAALWWAVQQILKPRLILAVQRQDELSGILCGLKSFDLQLEKIESPPQMAIKSLQVRQAYRKKQFISYFRHARPYNISLADVAVQPGRDLSRESFINRLIALRNKEGIDVALAVITGWQQSGKVIVVKAPPLEISQICCLIIGDITIDIPDQ
ncbi:MAG: Clp1/GlmU family protein [Sedimentisphaerales bacterium]